SQVVVVGDTVVSEQGMATIVGRDTRYRVCGTAHSFGEPNEFIQKNRRMFSSLTRSSKIATAFVGSGILRRNFRALASLSHHGNQNRLSPNARFVPEHGATG